MSEFLKVDTRYRKFNGIKLNEPPIIRAIAKRLAELVKEQVKRGHDSGGRSLKADKTGDGRPMIESGQMVDSIKARRAPARRRKKKESKTHFVVEPTGRRESGKVNNFGVHAINAHRRGVSVFRGVEKIFDEAVRAGQKPFDRQKKQLIKGTWKKL